MLIVSVHSSAHANSHSTSCIKHALSNKMNNALPWFCNDLGIIFSTDFLCLAKQCRKSRD